MSASSHPERCIFPLVRRGAACVRCGFVLLADAPKAIRTCAIGCTCRGEATGALTLVRCASCRGNWRQKLPTFTCAVFGVCVPAAAHENSSGVKGCVGCPEFGEA